MVYIRRLVWFIAHRLVILCVLLGMLLCGFFMAMNLANVYIILDEGLEKRVEVILTREDAEELNKYFHYDFLNADPALAGAFDGTSAYSDYSISDFEYDLKIESMWSWPWDAYATCTVLERVPSIQGKVLSSRANEISPDIPEWQGGRYNITLVKEDGLWRIIGMQQVAVIMDSESETPRLTEVLLE
ncbi:MAG: hypothetical protein U0L09_09995 [Christensenellales bacterium]|nr:hypothetical protein [Christensenellales bacterium]